MQTIKKIPGPRLPDKAPALIFLPIFIALLSTLLAACGSEKSPATGNPLSPVRSTDGCETAATQASGVRWQLLLERNCHNLAAYNLFTDPLDPTKNAQPSGQAFELAIPLFTDYANKYRFVFVPPGQQIAYDDRQAFQFPVGSVLVKTFALPNANQQPSSEKIIETRLLIHRQKGWVALPYVWEKNGTANAQARLTLEGRKIPSRLIQDGVEMTFDYEVPAIGECKTCHLNRQFDVVSNRTLALYTPIGLKARHLNRNITTASSGEINQLVHWQQQGLLTGLPDNLSSIVKLPLWDNRQQDENVTALAKGYLDINCSHCHNPKGAGNESGMFLEYWREVTGTQHGICKRPGGFNGGARGLSFDIIPGNADQSILPYRMELLRRTGNAKGQMPPLSRNLNHHEAISLIKQWINNMPAERCR